jgi:hypothetical protein
MAESRKTFRQWSQGMRRRVNESTWRNRSIVDFLVALKQAGHCHDDDVLAE